MLVYLYNHDVKEIEEDLNYLDNVDYCGTYEYGGGKKPERITMMHYCDHCNATLVGHWEYVEKYIRAQTVWFDSYRQDYEGKILDSSIKREIENKLNKNAREWLDLVSRGGIKRNVNKYFIVDKETEEDIDDFFYDLVLGDIGDVIKFKTNNERKELLTPILSVSKKIIQYRKEIEKFFSMKICPVCGSEFVKSSNKHVFFSKEFLKSDLYESLNDEFPNHLFELHKSMTYSKFSEIADEISNQPANVAFDYNGKLVKKYEINKKSDSVHLYHFDNDSMDSKLDYFMHFSKKKFVELSNQRLERTIQEFKSKPSCKVFDKNSFDLEGLKNYLKYLSQLESNAFSVTERLKDLYLIYAESEMDAYASQILLTLELKNNLSKTTDEYNKLEKTKPENRVSIKKCSLHYPEKPIAPEMPEQPVLKTAGLFNRKKVEAENNLLTQEYQAKLVAYNVEMELYLDELRKYNSKVEELEQKQKEIYSAKVEEARKNKQDKLDKLAKEIQDLQNRINEIENNGSDIVTQEKIKNELIESEIKEAEKTLCETYKALNELYSYDVIFSKYRNFVAVSTFYEYLSSGRCTALEGTDGAYNIYESEVRANMMISQLSQVITSLDKIQQNQFVIYSAIQESNRNLANLNSSMNSAVSALNDIKVTTKNMNSTMEKIAEHTAVAAYNSSVTAFYSQKNAELTNALGYMIALS